MQGVWVWVLTALWGTLFQLAISPFSWMDAAMEGVGERVGEMMETEATREPEEKRPKRRSLSMEDLRRKYSWWPNGGRREGQPDPSSTWKPEKKIVLPCEASRALSCSDRWGRQCEGECARSCEPGSQCRPNECILGSGNSGGSGFWNEGYMSQGREMGS
jgi:hypothetical protein